MRWLLCVILLIGISQASYAQDERFTLGFNAGLGYSQIDGDNLAGFKKTSIELGLLGGFAFNPADEFIVGLNYERLGSTRKGEDRPLVSGSYLAEIDIRQYSLLLAYSKSFSPNWDGDYKFKAGGGLKYNRPTSITSTLVAANVQDNYSLDENDFRNQYLSFRLFAGVNITRHFSLSFNYEHGLQSLLSDSEAVRFSRMIPFSFSFSLAYYVF